MRSAIPVVVVWLLAASACGQSLGPVRPVTERLPPVEATSATASSPTGKAPASAVRLTLDDLERTVLSGHPAIARAAAAVEAAQGDWRQAGLPPNPVGLIGQQQVGSGGRAEQDFVGFSQEFVMGGKLRLGRAVAAEQLARAKVQLNAQRTRVLVDLRIAFYSALVAQEQLAVANQLVAIARLGVETTKSSDKGALTDRNDVLEATIELRTSEIEASNSRNRQLAAWRRLAAVVGSQTFPLHQLAGNLAVPAIEKDWTDRLARLETESPEMAAAFINLQRAHVALKRASVEAVPNVTVQGVINWRDNGIGGDADGGLQVSVPLPILNRNQGGRASAAAEVAMASHNVEQLKLQLQDRLAIVFERYSAAFFQARQYRDKILPAAQEALELTRRNYRAGKIDYDDLLTSQRTNAQANLAYLSALRELKVAEVEIDGLLLTGSLYEAD